MTTPRATTPSRASASPRSLVVPVIALVVALALGVAAFAGGGDGSDESAGAPASDSAAPPSSGEAVEDPADAQDRADAQAQADAQAEQLAALERREEGDPLALGDPDAPVVMIEWADFQCPFCGAFARETKPVLVERFVEAGMLRIEWRDLPMLGEESYTAALGARAAAEQDAFWAFHDAIYAVERERNVGELDRERLIALADDLGLDTDRFEAAMDDEGLAEAVSADLQLAQSLGITGTPAFLINGQPLIGGQPTEVFVSAIEQMAEEADAA